jgi:molybdopterin synthase sulfur carrier subunit
MRVLYFAWIRERVGQPWDEVDSRAKTPRDLLEELKAREPRYALAFADISAIRVALDRKVARMDDSLHGVDEIAFFPPMTGG